ncbi:hypothetical protein PVAND_012241 [Polypedilum vanderplanki]|uniref:Uncharacterized protein n=1 Tax=Polypedilum vanderplanki TaxID=319348 RepID=A0A9J6CMS0_POLVA|nr:hypothetical protein PVAND_012241 [Polypedilum vanderplanki]
MDQKFGRKILCSLFAFCVLLIAINAAPHFGHSRERFGGFGAFGNFFYGNTLAAYGLTILPNGSIYSNFTGGILSGIVASNISNANFATNPAIDIRTGATIG